MAREVDFILIIDDSTTNQVLMEALLQEEGFATQAASNAQEAYKIIEKSVPRLIILDLLMPQVSGVEILKQLRESEQTVKTPIVVVSAVKSTDYIDESIELGANSYFTKPIDIPSFIKQVKEYLNVPHK